MILASVIYSRLNGVKLVVLLPSAIEYFEIFLYKVCVYFSTPSCCSNNSSKATSCNNSCRTSSLPLWPPPRPASPAPSARPSPSCPCLRSTRRGKAWIVRLWRHPRQHPWRPTPRLRRQTPSLRCTRPLIWTLRRRVITIRPWPWPVLVDTQSWSHCSSTKELILNTGTRKVSQKIIMEMLIILDFHINCCLTCCKNLCLI